VSPRQVAVDFDRISSVYDATRDPLDAATLSGLVRELDGAGVRRLLEVGVGTGRVAVPLAAHGLEVTGIDVSRGMLNRARAKGLGRFALASAEHLPFAAGTFDAVLFVHVLHVLDAPERALAEAMRAARHGAWAVVHPRSGRSEDGTSPAEVRRLVREELRRAGVPVTDRGGPAVEERRILERIPPTRLVVLSERTVTEPLSRTLDALASRAHRYTLHVPPDALDRAIAAVRARVREAHTTFRRVEALATWSDPAALGPRATALGP
jgi:ubiquinone/menaquinone biosynthesis C-methylase UbiE